MKRCIDCHELKPYDAFYRDKRHANTYSSRCRPCHMADGNARAAAAPERMKAYKRAYYLEHRERAAEQARGRYEANREQIIARANEWARTHPDERRGVVQRSKDNHRDRVRRTDARWREQNRERYLETKRVAQQQRIARKRDAGTFAVEDWLELRERYGNHCLACGVTNDLTIDHVIPLALGGANTIDNLQPLCMDCNRRKNATIHDYRPTVQAEVVS